MFYFITYTQFAATVRFVAMWMFLLFTQSSELNFSVCAIFSIDFVNDFDDSGLSGAEDGLIIPAEGGDNIADDNDMMSVLRESTVLNAVITKSTDNIIVKFKQKNLNTSTL